MTCNGMNVLVARHVTSSYFHRLGYKWSTPASPHTTSQRPFTPPFCMVMVLCNRGESIIEASKGFYGARRRMSASIYRQLGKTVRSTGELHDVCNRNRLRFGSSRSRPNILWAGSLLPGPGGSSKIVQIIRERLAGLQVWPELHRKVLSHVLYPLGYAKITLIPCLNFGGVRYSAQQLMRLCW